MNSTEEHLRQQLEEADRRIGALTAQNCELLTRLSAATKIIKPFADMRQTYGDNERQEIAVRMLGGVDHAWADRRVCLEVRHLTAALGWIKENGNG